MITYKTNSTQETKKLGKKIAQDLPAGIFLLTGDLGVGKTTFVQGFAQGLGIKEEIISPTFVLVRQHKIPKTNKTLFHIDLYRLENILDIKDLGLEEILSESQNIVLIEWGNKIEGCFPKKTIKIKIERINENTRSITVS